jgi:plasmid stabilization system protein ParE
VRWSRTTGQDRRDEVLYYRAGAGARVAKTLVDTMKKALQALEQQPGMGSPAIGQELAIDGLRACRLDASRFRPGHSSAQIMYASSDWWIRQSHRRHRQTGLGGAMDTKHQRALAAMGKPSSSAVRQ